MHDTIRPKDPTMRNQSHKAALARHAKSRTRAPNKHLRKADSACKHLLNKNVTDCLSVRNSIDHWDRNVAPAHDRDFDRIFLEDSRPYAKWNRTTACTLRGKP
jgi:hypothetical protein